jgi:hypothetical protein
MLFSLAQIMSYEGVLDGAIFSIFQKLLIQLYPVSKPMMTMPFV